MADKGLSGASEEMVIRLPCTIPKAGKALETGKSSGHWVMTRQIITSDEEVPLRFKRDYPDGI